ncbi:MAG: OmpA family protein [Pseudodesulfovibrio sp.]|uniref:OmpA/MotB domain protein n=1 Tax=Pseudodesulfovibrio aespoeensis (strain ATCC 700646 / DSM 10631 / Aspo-2) TaxID=643562 RepID=E6VVZ5_PSEA9|nr:MULTISPECIES: OmpA family protein [Pseudodesulfovibrio]MBU4192215.1 OmpA family protein [Pseudomonadota bacterium]ADU62440.1 OmpA/MotB domain protein [Pseudodesulfovibrio aespoeensis Aspo-2]MBU4244374.1 OmpA family protein [Pseudomonadota bacterium]MBU4380332.1 OmpA family protein [Pseudomonadota bacterium]MBU4473895.1 OmpA family protein [Pseudomonadota bacterium]
MRDMEQNFTRGFSSFEQIEGPPVASGANAWAVPWADLMMVMFVLFVVLFIYSSTHQDVKVLFSQQSADEAQAASALDPLIGLIGQLSSRAGANGSQETVRVADNQVLFRSRTDGVTVVREGQGRIRVTLRGDLFFAVNEAGLAPESGQYLSEIAEVVRLSVGTVHVIGYASEDEGGNEAGTRQGFALSTGRATEVADQLMTRFKVDPRRVVITGRGRLHPELPGTTPANQAMNRRVEIVITNEL